MTEQDKVTVDDIIGIVKTEEQTNSVEEVRKLRGRGNETAKRFKVTDNTDNPFLCDWSVTDYADGGIVHHPMTSENMAKVMCELLNELHEENTNLRKEKECNKQVFTKKRLHERLQQTRKENEQLKTTIQQLRTDNTKQKKLLNTTMKENEQLKSLIKALKKSNTDYVNQIKKAYDEKLSIKELADNCGVDLE